MMWVHNFNKLHILETCMTWLVKTVSSSFPISSPLQRAIFHVNRVWEWIFQKSFWRLAKPWIYLLTYSFTWAPQDALSSTSRGRKLKQIFKMVFCVMWILSWVVLERVKTVLQGPGCPPDLLQNYLLHNCSPFVVFSTYDSWRSWEFIYEKINLARRNVELKLLAHTPKISLDSSVVHFTFIYYRTYWESKYA